MLIKKGIPVSHGVAIGQAVVLDAEDQPIPRRIVHPSLVPAQHARLAKALDQSRTEIERQKQQVEGNPSLGPKMAQIFDYHLGMINDKSLTDQFRRMIDQEHVTAEHAVYSVMRRQAQALREMDIPYFRDRDRDIWDLERRVLGHLIGATRNELKQLKHDTIIIARDLTPSQTASFDKTKIKGIATDLGGSTSHTAILAKALNIPSVVGLGSLASLVSSGETVIVDGNRGQVIVGPDAAQTFNYKEELSRIEAFETKLGELAELPAQTLDGTLISLWGNIEFPGEIHAFANSITGVGLYRTEFLYLAGPTEPTEEEHYNAYVEAITALKGKPLTIRTLDLGADKLATEGITHNAERNPFLGVRSIRLCLQNPPLFMTQLRAILRASAHGPVRIMFPLVSNIMELRQAKMILGDVREDLERDGVAMGQDIPVGIMVEVPSAAIEANKFAKEADFFSIGTNDLIQYTVAVDRGNERIASLYSAANPAVLTLIRDVVRAANRAKIDVSICGEMAGDLEYVMLLIGLGLRSLSISPPAIPEVKKLIRSVSMTMCKRVARKAMSLDTDREILNYLRDEVVKVLPDTFGGRSMG
jgi:phosphotransferase system enzyme I (PtsI)